MSDDEMKTAAPAQAAPKKPRAKKAAAPANAIGEASESAMAEASPATGTALTVSAPPSDASSAAATKANSMIPDSMTDKAREVVGDVKDKASDAVQGLARIISDSAGAIDDNVGPKYGDYARTAAQSISDAADRLRAKPVDEIAEDTREFVRTKPAAALGIAAIAGVVLARIFGSVFGRKR